MQKIILHVPHSSNEIPLKDGFIASSENLKEEIMKLTDWYTNDLFQHLNAIQVVATFSRIFCDVERFSEDANEPMAAKGMGMLYTTLDNDRPLRKINHGLRNLIYTKYYEPHHLRLLKEVKSQLRKDKKVLILDCHSFSNKPFIRDLDKTIPRPDICIGTNSFHTTSELINKTMRYFEELGLNCKINSPYSGTMVPLQYYLKDNRVSSIMIEINRDLYLKAGTKIKTSGYKKMKTILRGYIEILCS